MTDDVNHPQHYTKGFASAATECIDITRHLPFTLGNAVKYTWRAGKKGDKAKALEDLQKASWYAEEWTVLIEHDAGLDWKRGLLTARAIFRLLIEPEGDPLEAARYAALERLLAEVFDMFEVEAALERMQEVIEYGR